MNYDLDKEIKMSPPPAPSHENSSEENKDKEEHLSEIMESYRILNGKLDESLKKIKNRKTKK